MEKKSFKRVLGGITLNTEKDTLDENFISSGNEVDSLLEKHWNLVKDNVGRDGLKYHERWTKEEHREMWYNTRNLEERIGYLKGVIHGLENGYVFHPA